MGYTVNPGIANPQACLGCLISKSRPINPGLTLPLNPLLFHFFPYTSPFYGCPHPRFQMISVTPQYGLYRKYLWQTGADKYNQIYIYICIYIYIYIRVHFKIIARSPNVTIEEG